ncbi:beta strand repeat-containing protein [Pseudooceanicola algae]|uniref:beta strand repeat-containing protein n=1 Tax=Pseudooceanicola algae TaxID=1537215 RepID=UPI0018C8E7ED|nr:tandem-95 repeat protein [Pseudooceanicola algae]
MNTESLTAAADSFGGTTGLGEFLVNSRTTSEQTDPMVTALADGGYLVTWITSDTTQDGSGSALKAQRYAVDGNAMGTEFLVNSETEGSQSTPAVTGLADGGWAITWTTSDTTQDGSDYAIKARVYAADGTAVGSEILANSETLGRQFSPSVTSLGDGGFVITWTTSDVSQDGSSSAIKGQVFAADGTVVSDEFLVNSQKANAQTFSSVTGLTDGGFVVTWKTIDTTSDGSSRGIRAQLYAADGTAIGTERNVVSKDPIGLIYVADDGPATVTALSNGGFVTAWEEWGYSEGDEGHRSSLIARIYTENGSALGRAFTVVSDWNESQGEPSVTGLANGGFVIAWSTSDPTEDGSGHAIKAQVYTADGTEVADELLVNLDATGDQISPSVTGLADGGFIITWQTDDTAQDGSGSAIKARAFNADGTDYVWSALTEDDSLTITAAELLANDNSSTGATLQVVSVTATEDTSGRLTDNGNGTWTYEPGEAFDYLPEGETATDTLEYIISDGSNTAAATVSITVLGTNDAPIATADAASAAYGVAVEVDVLANDRDPDTGSVLSIVSLGAAAHGVVEIEDQGTADTSDDTVLYVPDAGFVGTDSFTYVLSDGTHAVGGNVTVDVAPNQAPVAGADNITGTEVGEFLVNSGTNGDQRAPSVSGLADGRFLVTWTTGDAYQDKDGTALKAQLYAADGAKIGSEFLVNSEPMGDQLDPVVTDLTGGGFTIAWQSSDPSHDGSLSAIKARVFAEDGTGVGTEFLVNSSRSNSQLEPSMTGLADGGFLVTWRTSDTAQDGSGYAIKAQIYAANGATVGSEFLVNSLTSSSQLAPSSTGLETGGFVITWQTNDTTQDGSGYAIKAQIFDADGSAVGSEFLVNSTPDLSQVTPSITSLEGNGFVITWETLDPAQDGDGSALKAQIFDATGAMVGTEFIVNDATSSDQSSASVTSLAGGRFVVTWKTDDVAQDGSGSAIKAQVFDADGGAVGDEVLVNLENSLLQSDPSVTGLEDGGFVITWETSDRTQDGSGYAVKAQIFDADGSAYVKPAVTEDGKLKSRIKDLLANDSDPEGADLSVVSVDKTSETKGNIYKGDYSWLYSPGTAFQYLGAGETATDTLEYTISDGTDTTTAQITVTITGLNDAPEAADDDFEAPGTQPLEFSITDLLANDIDLDGDTLSFISLDDSDLRGALTALGNGLYQYDASALADDPATTGEIIDSFTYVVSDGSEQSTGTVRITASADTGMQVVGTEADETLRGGEGNDSLNGHAGDDVLFGEDGDDTVIGGAGNDTLLGSGGEDTVVGGDGQDTLFGGADQDTLFGGSGLDLLYGGDADDLLYGGSQDDLLAGGNGDDTLIGGDGDDTLDGNSGNDYFNGGDGIDTANFGGTIDTTVSLATTGTQSTGHGSDRLVGIENVTTAGGNDHLVGDGAANVLRAGSGNDRLDGDAGNDVLFGEDDDDLLFGGAGNDTLLGSAGNDLLFGSSGGDTAYGGSGDDTVYGGSDDDTLSGGSGLDLLYGGDADDLLYGGSQDDLLAGGNGDDTLVGGDGDDTLDGNSGNDYFNGGDGIDTANFGGTIDTTVSLATTGTQSTGHGSDRLVGIENVTTAGGNDHLVGDGAANVLRAGSGNDRLDGDAGNDVLFGEDDDDLLFGGAGNDTLLGSAGNDLLFGSSGGDTAYGGSGDDTVYGGSDDDTLSGGSGLDLLYGGDADDLLYGGSQDDLLAGGNGDDTLVGGDGDDTLDGNSGNDYFNGGDGIDTANFGGTIDTTVSLATTGTQSTGHGSDRLVGIENVTTAGGNDHLVGDGAANVLRAGSGNDRLDGDAGNDVLFGEDDDDLLFGGAGNDTLLGSAGNDLLFGSSGGDTAYGGSGDDTVYGGSDDDTLSGGSGLDLLYGGDADDLLYGGSQDDLLAGGNGDDTLVGGDGDDTLDGNSGNDLLRGLGDDDVFIFRTGYEADRILDFGEGTDRLRLKITGLEDVSDLEAYVLEDDGDLIFDFGDGDMLQLDNLSFADLMPYVDIF